MKEKGGKRMKRRGDSIERGWKGRAGFRLPEVLLYGRNHGAHDL